MLPPTFEVEILDVQKLSPSVRQFVLARADGEPIAHIPGQWVNLVLPTAVGEVRRAYSIASPPRGGPVFEIAVTEVLGGPGSGYLAGLQPGARLLAVGPQGFFTRDAADARPALFVGTGTGVTPLRAMILAAAAHTAHTAQGHLPMTLLFGVRHEHDILYRDEWTALAERLPGFRVELTLSQGAPEWGGRRGYVQSHIAEQLDALAREERGAPHVYVCGLERMVAAVRHLTRKELGLPRERVHSERYD